METRGRGATYGYAQVSSSLYAAAAMPVYRHTTLSGQDKSGILRAPGKTMNSIGVGAGSAEGSGKKKCGIIK